MNNSEARMTASRRAGPLFGAALVVAAVMAVLAPAAPVARALDPTPPPATADPGASGSPDPGVTPGASDTPTPSPTPAATDSPAPSAVAPSDTPAPSDASPTPAPSDAASPSAAPAPSDSPDPSASPSPSPSESVPPGGAVRVEHFWVSTLDQTGAMSNRGPMDQPLVGASRFTVYLVRFQVANVGSTAKSIIPRIDTTNDGGAWVPAPAVNPVAGEPFYAAADDGMIYVARSGGIAATDLWLSVDSDGKGQPAEGASSAGKNPLPPVTLPAHSFTEIEFAIRADVDAAWLANYRLHLSNGPDVIPGSEVEVTMGAKPFVRLSPGAQPGAPVADQQAAVMRITTFLARAALSTDPAAVAAAAPTPPFTSPHTNYTLTTDFCAACHADHSAASTYIRAVAAPSANQCFQCHDGLGANANIKAQMTDAALPPNDALTSSYFAHPVMTDTGHISDRQDEFGGQLNRHSVCADCHQPHNATTTRPTETAGGWTAAGSIAGASGVSVTNGAATSQPKYQLNSTSTLEYQLCFKCHSGYTTLPTQDPSHPSWWALDKGVELNPANVSYHPVEAAGKNQSDAIKLSLSGDAPGKLWSFTSTSTVRCTNCHGSPSSVSAGSTAADAQIDNHASANRGILLANYQDRVLKSSSDLYDASNFSLCYLCHAEGPMVDDSGDRRYDTNFNWHGFHLNDIWYKGTGGTSIDVAGDGRSNALCAECHFRTHGTALAANGQPPATGLLNFAPDVTPYNGQLKFVPATPTSAGSCTLTCHGKAHNNFPYQYGYPVP